MKRDDRYFSAMVFSYAEMSWQEIILTVKEAVDVACPFVECPFTQEDADVLERAAATIRKRLEKET